MQQNFDLYVEFVSNVHRVPRPHQEKSSACDPIATFRFSFPQIIAEAAIGEEANALSVCEQDVLAVAGAFALPRFGHGPV
jgi:hypothetical protein